MRRIYLTETQLKHILGEDFTSYLPNEGDGVEEPENSSGYEITVTDDNIDGEPTDVVTTDKIGKERYPMNFYRVGYSGYASGVRGLAEETENLNETNQDLVNTQFRLSKNNKENVQNMADKLGNDRLLNNMANETSFNVKTLYKRRYDLNKMKTEDPERFARINGGKLLNDIENQLEVAKKSSANTKRAQSAAGIQNVYQKAGGTKDAFNGKAHSTKNGNITYFN